MTAIALQPGKDDARDRAPALQGVLETALYFDDLTRARSFYEDVLGLAPMFEDERVIAYPIGPSSVLLLFRRGQSAADTVTPGGVIPGHDGGRDAEGAPHIAFAIRAADLDRWARHLGDRRIAVESRVRWPRGGTSLFFRDPEGHLLEVATPGLWPEVQSAG